MEARLHADAEIRRDLVGGAHPDRADRLDRARSRKHIVHGVERTDRPEVARPGEIDPGDEIGRQLPHPVADDSFASGERGPGELREAARGRPQTGLVTARRPDAEDDAVVESMVVADIALAADPALDPLATPGRDPGPDIETGPRVGRDLRRIGREL